MVLPLLSCDYCCHIYIYMVTPVHYAQYMSLFFWGFQGQDGGKGQDSVSSRGLVGDEHPETAKACMAILLVYYSPLGLS